jgi:hypothetical protein
MKKFFNAVLLLVIAGALGFALYLYLTPKSKGLLKQYREFISTIDEARYRANESYRFETDQKLHDHHKALARAYLDEKKPDKAIEFIEGLIKSESGTHYLLGERVPKNSGQTALLAIYHGWLAEAYGQMNDETRRLAALKKKELLMREAEALEKRGR